MTMTMRRRTVLRTGICFALTGLASRSPGRISASMPAFQSNRIGVTARGALGALGHDIVLIPGLASGPLIWSPLVHRLTGHRCHLVHVAGFAGQPAGANAKGPLLRPVANEIARYIRENRLRSPVLIGHSLGGTLALMLGTHVDIKANRIMVVDMLPDGSAMLGGTSQGLGYLAQQLNGYLTGTKAGRQLLAEMVRQTPEGRDSDPAVIAEALAELAQTDLTPDLKRILCPLTVVPALPGTKRLDTAQAQRYRSAYAAAHKLTIAGIGPSGHMVMLDRQEQFARTVLKFLA